MNVHNAKRKKPTKHERQAQQIRARKEREWGAQLEQELQEEMAQSTLEGEGSNSSGRSDHVGTQGDCHMGDLLPADANASKLSLMVEPGSEVEDEISQDERSADDFPSQSGEFWLPQTTSSQGRRAKNSPLHPTRYVHVFVLNFAYLYVIIYS